MAAGRRLEETTAAFKITYKKVFFFVILPVGGVKHVLISGPGVDFFDVEKRKRFWLRFWTAEVANMDPQWLPNRPKRSQNVSENEVEQKDGAKTQSLTTLCGNWVGPAECAGHLGRDFEGLGKGSGELLARSCEESSTPARVDGGLNRSAHSAGPGTGLWSSFLGPWRLILGALGLILGALEVIL